MRLILSIVLSLFLPGAAIALTVAEGATRIGDTAEIKGVEGPSIGVPVIGSYSREVTTPTSDWVWIGHYYDVNKATFEFTFDLTGYDLATVSLTGLWAVDNEATAYLNGTSIAELRDPFLDGHTYSTMSEYGTTDAGLFVAGLNRLRFDAVDTGYRAAFRATATVMATPAIAAAPLPAGGLLLLSGFGVLGAARLRKRRS